MSISMEKFSSEGQFATYDPFQATISRVAMFHLQCHQCGFEPADGVIAPRVCPKCHSAAWERVTRPGSILENANRYEC
jgi:rubrerythrin